MLELQITNTSNANTLALLFLVIASLAVLFARPRYAVAGFLLTALFIPLGQQFVIAGLHFRFLRVLIIFALVRMIFRRETRRPDRKRVDRLIVVWALVCLAFGLLRGPKAEMFGAAYDVLGGFFVFRALMPATGDLVWLLKVLAVGVVVLAACMFWERTTTQNPFFVLGGVPEYTFVRDGRLRCQGPFRHPILAGTFAATLFPLLVGLWRSRQGDSWIALGGLPACLFTCYAAGSSGAILTLLVALAGLGLWRMRNRMAVIRWTAVAGVLALAAVMKAPVWYLIAKVSKVSGGTGWHRSFIIDQAIRNVNEWWLVGSSRTAHWATDPSTILAVDPDNMDITNFYIQQGLKGGLLGLSLFLAILVACFRLIGRAVRTHHSASRAAWLYWGIGVAFASHCAAFMSVSYFDQMLTFWVWLVAVIAALPQQISIGHGSASDPGTVIEEGEYESDSVRPQVYTY